MKRGTAIGLVILWSSILSAAQTIDLRLINGKATVKKTFAPRTKTAAVFYRVAMRKGEPAAIGIDANSIFLSSENECSMFFELFDPAGKAVFIGDDPVGIGEWRGTVEMTGYHKIKAYMGCLEGFSNSDLTRRRPRFNYSLSVSIK